MTLTGVLISLVVGCVFVIVWGIVSHIVARRGEFKGVFLGGLANFLFFLGGVLAPYLAGLMVAPGHAAPVVAAVVRGSGFSLAVALCVAVATTLAFLAMNLCAAGFTDALERMRRLKMISFTAEGYRNTQLYFAGAVGVLCLLAAMIYGVYLGSARPYATYLSVLAGVLVSLGVQSLLYWLFGMFGRYQLLGIVRVNTPAVLGSYGATAQKLFAVAVTSMLSVFLVLVWTTLLWLGVTLGGLASKLPALPLL